MVNKQTDTCEHYPFNFIDSYEGGWGTDMEVKSLSAGVVSYLCVLGQGPQLCSVTSLVQYHAGTNSSWLAKAGC